MYVRTYSQVKECTVQMTERLAEHCGPLRGDPKGITKYLRKTPEKSDKEAMKDALLKYGDFVIKGTESNFVCIAQADYEEMLCMLG